MTSHSDVAHAWAHKLSIRKNGKSIFHENGEIYSYGYHFMIARHSHTPAGKPCVLLTTRGYSSSTAGHISMVGQAIPKNIPTFCVDNVQAETKDQHKKNYHLMLKAREDTLGESARARTRTLRYLGQAQRQGESLNAYTKAFRLGFHEINTIISETTLEEIRVAQVLRDRQAHARAKESIRRWMNFLINRAPRTPTPYVRINIENQTVETSYGASVPLFRSRALHRLAKICKAKSRSYIPSKPQSVGYYGIYGIRSNGTLRVGCHSIPLKAQILAAKAAGAKQ